MKSLGGQRVAILIQRTSRSLIIEISVSKNLQGQRVAILIQRTRRSLIIEEVRGSTGSDFDTVHEQELDY